MEEQMSSLAVTHLLQHTLRSLCTNNIHNSQWVYAVFWRILPRNYPPPKWDSHQGGAYDRSRGNRRNWILVWEDGFCNFGASSTSSSSSPHHHHEMNNNINGGEEEEDHHHHHHHHQCPTNSLVYDYNHHHHHHQGLQPELFFKMSHEIYNYGEGLIGKVAADHSHKWIYKEPNNINNNNQEINFLSAWHNSPDSHPRTWEAQFQSGIKTIALIAVREGVIQLGAVQKVIEDLSYVVLLRKKFSYIESIPGVLLPHPSSTPPAPPLYPFIKIDSVGADSNAVGSYSDGVGAGGGSIDGWQHFHHHYNNLITPSQLHIPPPPAPTPHTEFYDHYNINQQHHPMKIAPSMSSLEALLSKLPSVVVPPAAASTSPPPPVPILPGVAYHVEGHDDEQQQHYVTSSSTRSMDVGKEEEEDNDQEDEDQRKKKMKKMKKNKKNVVSGDCHDHDQNSSSVSSYHPNNQHFGNHHNHHHHQDLNHVSHGY